MMKGTMFSLDERLALCASFVRNDTRLVDVGTDHAYLPIWLALNGRIRSAVACDVRVGPLENAAANIRSYHVEHIVSTVLSDGLNNIDPDAALDIVVAGMGGELIADIITRQQWLCDTRRRLILQPMTKAESLRFFLCSSGFQIIQEKACVSGKKSYSVMMCEYDGQKRDCTDIFRYIGDLENEHSYEAERYIGTVKEKLQKKLRAYRPGDDEHTRLLSVISHIESLPFSFIGVK